MFQNKKWLVFVVTAVFAALFLLLQPFTPDPTTTTYLKEGKNPLTNEQAAVAQWPQSHAAPVPAAPRDAERRLFLSEVARLRSEWSQCKHQQPPSEIVENPQHIIWLEIGPIVPPAGLTLEPPDQQPTPRNTLPYLVQLSGPILDEWKAALESAGCILRGYIPENTFLVEACTNRITQIAALPFVRAVAPYKASYKVQPFLYEVARYVEKSTTNAEIDQAWPSLDVRIQTLDPEDAHAVAEALQNQRIEVLNIQQGRRWGRIVARLVLRNDMLDAVAVLGAVQWIEEVTPREWHNDFAVEGRHLNVTNVWARYGLTGRRQVIGHADTGLDSGSLAYLHPDFIGRVRWAVARGRPGDWSDPHGHGTHTAGSILGDGSASTGQFRGVAFEAELVHQSVLDAHGGLGGLPDDLYELYQEAYTNAARLHSDSWGAPVYGAYNLDSQSSDEFMWDYPDMLLIFSAGNEGRDGNSDGVVDRDSIGAPGTAKNLVTVGAAESDRAPGSGGYSSMAWGYAWPSHYPVDPIRNDYISQSADLVNQGLAAFSSRGPTDDGRIKPDVVAPGTDVISCRSRRASSSAWGLHPNTNYMFSGGTSMAAPLVAGLAALIRQYYMEWRGVTNPSAALVKATLINGARSLTPGQYGTGAAREIPAPPRPNTAEGWGQPDLLRTLFPNAPRKLSACDTNRLSTGGTNEYRLYLSMGITSSVTLAYTDYPGTAGAGKKLINDLDLLVLGPTGAVYYPNGLGSADRSNNVEGLDFVPPVSGIYTVRVAGFNVPNGPQPYAVVFNGGWVPVYAQPVPNTTNTVASRDLPVLITSLGAGAGNQFWIMWNTDGSLRFNSNTLEQVSGPLYRGWVPPQPMNTTVYYYFTAYLEGRMFVWPTGAPSELLSYRVSSPVTLTISGTPVETNTPQPGYGVHVFASGTVVTASVAAATAPSNGERYACAGWTGTGDVPPVGPNTSVIFTLNMNSMLTWQWDRQFSLTQASAPAGLLNTTTWWTVGTTAMTIAASESVRQTGTNWMFAQWRLNGARLPDDSSRAVNPAGGIVMSTACVVVAEYLPETHDSDANGLSDWWEYRYFGQTGVAVAADADADGFANLTEFLDRADPTDAGSTPSPPIILHTPLTSVQTAPAPWRVTATITDSGSVASVTLGWTRNGSARQEIPMIPFGGIYTNALPAPGTNGDYFVYDIVATDAAGLASTSGPWGVMAVYGVLSVVPAGTQTVWTTPGGVTSLTFAVNNLGNTSLVWSVRFTPSPTGAVAWWSAAATGGTLSAASGTNIVLSLSGADLTSGAQRTLFADWLSTGPTQPSNRVTIRLSIGWPPTIGAVLATNTADTNGPYAVEAIITPAALVNTNDLFVFWNTNGNYVAFATSILARVTGDLYRAWIPGQPRGARIYFYIWAAGTNMLAAREPANAPYALRQFSVVSPKTLTVTGMPLNAGTVVPAYGDHIWPSGALISATAPAMVNVAVGERYRCTGWSGSGSVPTSGSTTQLAFALNADSTLAWQWQHEYCLLQTSNIPWAVVTSTWWNAASVAQTILAPWHFSLGGTNYRFAEWRVDGSRVPPAGRAMNPVTGIVMGAARTAEAIFLPEQRDTDGDGLPDWWLARYGMTGGSQAPVAMYWFDRPMGHELVLDGTGVVSLGKSAWSSDESFSMAFWLRPRSTVGLHGIAGSTGTVCWAVYQSGSNLCAAVYTVAGETSIWLEAAGVLQTDRWRHVTWIYNAPTQAVLFVDAQRVATSGVALAFNVEIPAALGRAALPHLSVSAFAGRLDNWGLWSVPLTDDEVSALYRHGVWPVRGNVQRLSFDADYENRAIDHSGQNRDAAYLGTATSEVTTILWDRSGRGHHGVYVGALWVQDVEFGEVFFAEGGNEAVVPHHAQLMPTSRMSVVANIRAEAVSDWHSIAIKTENEEWSDGYGLYARGISGTQLVGFVNEFDFRAVRTALDTGVWVHAASVFSGTNMALWVQGAKVAESNFTTAIMPNTGPLRFAAYRGQWGFVGRLREVRIYTNALASGDVVATQLAMSDTDSDGWNHWREFLEGTDPTDVYSVPAPPVIFHTPLGSLQTTPGPWMVTAVVTSASEVVRVALWWRRSAGVWNVTWMTNSGMNYSIDWPVFGADGDAFEYRIEALSGAGSCSTSGPYSFSVAYPRVSFVPTNLELNWLLPGTLTTRTVHVNNAGSVALQWRLHVEAAGLPRDDVEKGAGAWTHGGANDLWRVTTNRSVSATHSWYAGEWSEPGYVNSMNAWLMNGPVFIPQGAQLRFSYWIASEVDENNWPYAHDGGVVEVSTNGIVFAAIAPRGGYPYRAHGLYGSPFSRDTGIFAGTGGWQSAAFDLSDYAGQTLWIRFRFGSDEAFTVGEGWYVDDIEVIPAHEDNTWISLPTATGLVAAFASSNISIVLDATALDNGAARAARAIWTFNDPTQSLARIPISLFVGAPLRIQHEPLGHTTETSAPYVVSARMESQGLMPTGSVHAWIVWSTNLGVAAWTNAMQISTGDIWTGVIPAQPYGADVSYYVRADGASVAVLHPSNAPSAWHTFFVRPPAVLTVTGSPARWGAPRPAYGDQILPVGIVLTADAPDSVVAGTWLTCTGWTGSGSVPTLGATNRMVFTFDTTSVLRWCWDIRYLFLQTSSPAGLLSNSAWLVAGSITQTVVAPLTTVLNDLTYRFCEWRLNGIRQGAGQSVNPVTGITMTSAHYATAVYLPESQDTDGDGLPDAWEIFYFGDLSLDGNSDPDADGFNNFIEYSEQTDPTSSASVPAWPAIFHTPIADPQTTPPPWLVTAVVTDNVGLASVPASGYALRFATTTHYAIRSTMKQFPTSSITVEFWMKSSDRARRGTPFSYAVPGGFNDANEFTLYNHNTFLIYRGSVYTNTRVGASDGVWHHIAVTWRGSDGRTRLYKDGVLAFESVLQPGTTIRPNGILVLGQDQDSFGGGFSTDDAFVGLLDEVRIWNIERDGDAIRNTMSNRLTGAEMGLVSYWNMEDADGNTAQDMTPQGNHLTLMGAVWTNADAFYGANVWLYWNRNSNGWQRAFMSGSGSNSYAGRVGPPGRNGDRFEYRIEATDQNGLTATSGIHVFSVSLPEIACWPMHFTNIWLIPNAQTSRWLWISNAGSVALGWRLVHAAVGATENVEKGTNAWVSSGVNNQWHITTLRSYSPTLAWFFGDEAAGTYANNADATLDTPPISLAPGARLTFWHWCDLEMRDANVAWDGGIVEISTNKGLSYTKLTPVGGYPFTVNGGYGQPFPGGSGVFAGWGGWTQAVFDLSAYAGADAVIRFRCGSDMINDYAAQGWFIDDIVITPDSGTTAWFSASAMAGSLGVGEVTNVALNFNAAELTAGDVVAEKLLLVSDDLLRPTNTIPVVLKIGLYPVISHTPIGNQPLTSTSYAVSASITPPEHLNTNRLHVLWNTNGIGYPFQTSSLVRLTGDVYRAAIPAQPPGTRVYYYILATAGEDLITTHPPDAPSSLHSFDVTEMISLTVTGTPALIGTVSPAYGVVQVASGGIVMATALPSAAMGGTRWAAAGWTGSGSVPAAGAGDALTFTCRVDSLLNWQWQLQYLLSQTTTIRAGFSTHTWWFAGATAETVYAQERIRDSGTNYFLAHWLVDGARWPDATNVAANPAGGLIMNTARTATAVYLPEFTDLDGDDLPDWWEYRYFGGLGQWRTHDPDGDGFHNELEFRDRTNPRDPASYPQPPHIQHVPLTDPQTPPAPWLISATVTDNFAVATASVWWQRNAGLWQQGALTTGPASTFVGALPGPAANGDLYSYYIEASDYAGLIATSGPYMFSVALPGLRVAPTNLGCIFLTPNTSTTVAFQIWNEGGASLVWTARVKRSGFWEDVELGTNGWTHGGMGNLWHISTSRAASGVRAWYGGHGISRAYANQMNAWLLSPAIALPTGAVLRFMSYMDSEMKNATEAYDGGIVELSVTGGAFFAIAPRDGYPSRIANDSDGPFTNGTPCLAGTGGWQHLEFNLAPWGGQTAQLRFRFGSDSSKTREGWYVDDIGVYPGTGAGAWLTLAPTSGALPKAWLTHVNVTLDAFGLAAGTWWPAELRIVGSAGAGVFDIPLIMVVYGGASDYDGDGMVDEWELLFGLDPASPADAAADADGDQMANLAEFLSGTDPQDASSYFRMAEMWWSNGLRVGFAGVSGRIYRLQVATNLFGGAWSNVAVQTAESNAVHWLHDTSAPSPRRYYRLVLQPE